MKHKRLNRDGWGFQYYPYYQMRIDVEDFHGLVCLIRLTDGEENYWATPKAGRIQVTGAGMTWLELIPDHANRVITIKYFPDGTHDAERVYYPVPENEKYQPSIWYVDVTDGIEYDEDGIAVYIDKYLDVIFTPEGDVKVDDRDELDEAYRAGDISREQYDAALLEGDRILQELCADIPATNRWCARIRQIAEDRIAAGEPVKKCREVLEKRSILLLFTGGTIASVRTENGLEPILNAEQMLSYLPEMGDSIRLSTLQVCNLDSTNMDCHYWLKIVEAIEENYPLYDGFVICHGTDTMAYTAAALSYLIQDPDKPIVLTGSQQPIQVEITDAKKNLYDSIIYAADPLSAGVCLIFDGKVIAGTRAKKTQSSSYHAFSSINFPELATMQHGKLVRFFPCEKPAGPVRFYHEMNPRVFVLKLTPGISPTILQAIFEEYDCIVVESFGVGGIPDSIMEDFCRLVQRYPLGSKVIIMATQVTYEGSNMSTYEVGRRIQGRFPCLEAYDMNFEAVFTKIMWIMGQKGLRFEEIEKLFYTRINHDILGKF